jgi:hypothetical protein
VPLFGANIAGGTSPPSMKKILLVAFVLYATPVLAGGKSKPQSAKTQAHADRAAKDAGKTNDASLAASRQKLAAQRQKQADQQRKKEAAKPRR